MNKTFLTLIAGGALLLTACDDSTLNVGVDTMPEGDGLTASAKVYNVQSQTVQVSSVLANTPTCYLGSVVDPETRIKTTSDFLAQFHVPTNFVLPALDKLVKNDAGEIVADSCDIRLYIDTSYGDSLAAMKLSVQELDINNVLDETKPYYTDINPADYVSSNTEYNRSVSYTVKDLARPETENSGNTYYRQIVVRMPVAFGTRLMRAYYDNPDNFTSSYKFIRNVCPGFYFKNAGGVGSLLTTAMIGMNVYFRYHSKTSEGKDTITDGMQRFGATEEVIQTTHVDNQYPGSLSLEDLTKQNCTYIKTPASFFTEMTLPVGDIVAGEHYNDSINQAKITIRKFNNQVTSDYTLPAPSYLLLVRKSNMRSFFEEDKLPNSTDSYLSNEYSESTGAYQFSNISQLITDLRIERDKGAGVELSDDEATRQQKYAVWEQANPDWNKVMLVPVTAYYTTSTNYYGQTVKTLRSIRNNLGLSSARLEGSSDNPLQIQIVYSRQK